MANYTKSKGENEVYLCNLPAARVIPKTSFFIFYHFSVIIISFFFKKIKFEIFYQNYPDAKGGVNPPTSVHQFQGQW